MAVRFKLDENLPREEDHYFLKTIIPSRKATRDYLKNGEDDEET